MQKHIPVLTILYIIFIIYGSLIPFDFHPKSLTDSVQTFKNIPYLNLSMTSRADWIANILLYIPLTILLHYWFEKKIINYFIRSIIVLTGALFLAIGIEFIQLFFPPRTVSINDLMAEFIGSLTGITLWYIFHNKIRVIFSNLFSDKLSALTAFFNTYLIFYLLLSFFPFDFIISINELNHKLSSQNIGWLFSNNSHLNIIAIIKLFVETLLVIPIGFLFFNLNKNMKHHLSGIFLLVIIISSTIEILQLFLISGVTQGISIITRTLGFYLGYRLYKFNNNYKLTYFFTNKTVVIYIFLPLYLFVIFYTKKFYHLSFNNIDTFSNRLENLSFLPFYYHYYTTETVAMVSFLSNFLLYLPIGIFFGLWSYHTNRLKQNYITIFTAVFTSFIIELFTLLWTNQHPDPTNILVAIFASLSGLYIIGWIKNIHKRSINKSKNLLHIQNKKHVSKKSNILNSTSKQTRNESDHKSSSHAYKIFGKIQYKVLSLIAFIVIITSLINYPVAPIYIGIYLILYATLIWYKPYLWLLITIAALPVLDLAPLSGHFYWNIFDLLLTTTIGVFLWKGVRLETPLIQDKKLKLLLIFFSISWLISMFIGLSNITSFDANAFTSELSPYNALRVAKGLFWAVLLLPILAHTIQENRNIDRILIRGLAIGLAGVSFFVIWERILFPGLLNFSNNFRITGPFSSMHTGGGHIEAYLVLVLPILINSIRLKLSKIEKSIYICIIFIALYSLFVTYARTGYFAFAVSLLILLYGLFTANRWHWHTFIFAIIISIIFIAAQFQSSFMQQRFINTANDMQTRIKHWSNTVEMMDDSIINKFLGMGLGQFPGTFNQYNSEQQRLANFKFITEQNNTYLQLINGQTMYFEQIIKLRPNTNYLLSVDLMSRKNNNKLTFPICEKAMLYSFQCLWDTLQTNNDTKVWSTHTYAFSGSRFNLSSIFSRTIKLSLYTPDGTINIDNISITDDLGHEIIKNGDFEAQIDNWFFSTDNHLPWHIKQLFLQIYFSQGVIGLILFILICFKAIQYTNQAMLKNNIMAAGLLAGITAFLIIGLFSSIFDAPRLSLLFFLILNFIFLKYQHYFLYKKNNSYKDSIT